jgi:gliding motility-associated-like protein
MKNILLILTLLAPYLIYAQGADCASMDPICTDVGATFTANTGTTSEAGNDYGCLITQPNPSWYYFEVATNGNIDMSLTAASDIDFIIWGPFANLAAAQANCGSLSAAQTVDCSFSGTNNETPSIPAAVAGEVYIMLITNYAAVVQDITLTQTGGTGSTDCNIVNNPPCFMNYFEANISACDALTDTYDVTGQIDFDDPPALGDLIVVDCNGNQTIVASAPFAVNGSGAGSYNYTLTGSNANGAPCDVTAYFSADPTCTMNITYTAPICLCSFTYMTINQGPCDPVTNTFDVSGSVDFQSPPTTGTLTFTDCEGNTDTYFAPFTSPQTYTLPGITPNGTASCVVTAVFSSDPGCNMTSLPFTDPANCTCPVDIGTFTETTLGNTNSQYELCFGDSFSWVPNGDFIPHDDLGAAVGTPFDPGIEILLFDCPPTVQPPAGLGVDPCLLGLISNGTGAGGWTVTNTTGDGLTFWYAPVSMYNWQTNIYGIIYVGDVCYDIGFAYPLTFLEEIIANTVEDCFAGTATTIISGGTPALDGSNFNIVPGTLLPANANFVNTTTGNFGDIVIDGLVDGDVYSYDVVDDHNCPITITGVFQGLEDASFAYDFKYCQDDADPLPVITGVPGGTFTATPAGLSINGFTGLIDLSASTPGTYTIQYESPAFTCWGTETFTLTINPQPIVIATEDSPICDDGVSTITLNETGGEATEWAWTTNGGAAFDFDTLQSPTVSGAVNGETFTVTAIDINTGCINTDQVSVIVNPLDDPAFTLTDFCIGSANSATVTGTTGGTFAFAPDLLDGAAVNGATGEITNEVAGTTYTIQYLTAGVCPDSSIQTVTVNGLPTILTADVTVCLGGNVNITAAGALTYLWSPGTYLNTTAGATVTSTPLANISYTITGTDANGCQNTAIANVTVSGNAPINAGPDVTICDGDNTTLIATGGISYTWDQTLGNGNNFVVSPTVNTTYTVIGIDANGCSGTDLMVITISPLPTATIGTDATVCLGDAAPTITFTGANGTAPYTFTYTINGGANTTVTSVGTTATVSAPTGAAGTFAYNLVSVSENSATNCSQAQVGTATVIVNPLPTATIGTDATVCLGDAAPTITFTGANGTAPYTFTYNINGGANTTVTSVGNTATVAAPTGVAGTFDYNLVSVSDNSATNCSQAQVGTATVIVNPLPTATVTGTASVCENDPQPTITFTGANGVAPYTFTYNINGSIQPTIVSVGNTATVLVPTTPVGTYNFNLIDVTDASTTACSQIQAGTATITVNPNPVPVITGTAAYCTGTFATLSTSTPFAGYLWSTGAVTPNVNVTIVDNPITVTVTNAFGCSGTSAPFNVLENSVIVYTSNIEICQGESVMIHGVSQSAAGVYDQNFILGTGCDSTSSVTLIVNPLPIMDAGLDQVNCEGNDITLNGVGAPIIVWSPLVNNGTPFPQAVGTVTYIVTGTDANGCQDTDDVDVTINPLPTATIGTDVIVCLGDVAPTITFTGANGIAPYTFTYNINGGANAIVVSIGNTATVTAPTGIAGTFDYNLVSVSDNSATNCSQAQVATATVIVNPLPTAIIGTDVTVCLGDVAPAITFTGASGTAPYTFTYNINGGADVTVLSVGNTATVAASTGTAGTFTYNLVSVEESGTNCSQLQAGSATVIVNPLPTATIGVDVTVCIGAASPIITFTGANGTAPYTFTYNINGGVNTTITSVGNIAAVTAPTGVAGVFSYDLVSVSDASAASCSQVQVGTATVTVSPGPNVDPIADDVLCANEATAGIVFTSSSVGTVFDWTNSLTSIGLGASGSVDIASFTGLNGGATPSIATITVTPSLAGCAGSPETFTITVNPLPTVFAGNDFTVCEGDQAVLTASGAFGYVWTAPIIDGLAFIPLVTGDYFVTGTDANGCIGTDDVNIIVEPLPIVSFTADVTSGCAPLEVTFTNTSAGSLTDCIWTFGNGSGGSDCGSITTTYQNGGTYDVSLTTTSANGCTSTVTYTDYIYVEDAPDAAFTPSSSVVSVFNSEILFDNTSTGAVNYVWDFGDGSPTTTQENPLHDFPNEGQGTYLVELIAYSSLGCPDTTWRSIVVNEELIFYVPNTFTPDSDDFNETFNAIFTTGYDPFDFNLFIFNRWGEVIWESHDVTIGWDATYGTDGRDVQDGTYTWKIDFKTTQTDERIMVIGHVNVLR